MIFSQIPKPRPIPKLDFCLYGCGGVKMTRLAEVAGFEDGLRWEGNDLSRWRDRDA